MLSADDIRGERLRAVLMAAERRGLITPGSWGRIPGSDHIPAAEIEEWLIGIFEIILALEPPEDTMAAQWMAQQVEQATQDLLLKVQRKRRGRPS